MPNTTHANANYSAQTLVTTAETVIATLTPFNVDNPAGEGVLIQGDVNVSPGTAATQIVLRVRQGGLTGTLVGVAMPNSVAATNTYNIGSTWLDASALALLDTGLTYVLTAQQTSATANGTVNAAIIAAGSTTAVEA